MRQFIAAAACMATILQIGCGQKPVAVTPAKTADPVVQGEETSVVSFTPLPPVPAEFTAEARYEGALGEAMTLLANGQLADALNALREAQKAKDTEFVRTEIDRLKQRVDDTVAASQLADDLRIVLKQGRADEVARLAAQALLQYGGGPSGASFAELKRQADSMLVSTQDRDNQAARFQREAEAAKGAKNYRAALLAYEQALALRADEPVKKQYEELRATLTQYDQLRGKADELRRQPEQMEEAVALYRQAGQLWDTLQVRQDIDACMIALQHRKDRVAIAEFDVRADMGMPHAGRAIVDELVPAFRGRFDVVERQQLAQLVEELRLPPGELLESEGPRRDIGRLTRARYMVVGSVTPSFGGLIVNSRLLEVGSGLVVQTARLVAANPPDLLKQLPQLALLLQMTDGERLQYEQSLNRLAPVPVIETSPLLPPPPPISTNPAPPILAYLPRCPNMGNISIEEFNRLPPLATRGPANGTAATLAFEAHHAVRPRLTFLSLELGDNLFRRGLFKAAYGQFQIALALNHEDPNIQQRLDRCVPHLPPPASSPQPPRLRLAVLDFVTPEGSTHLPAGSGALVADGLAPYFAPAYRVVERGQVNWYMARLGLNLSDVVFDPIARAYLGQALEVRYFVVGTLRTTSSGMEVAAHMLDALSGERVDTASLEARNFAELRITLGELARWMLIDPSERTARTEEGAPFYVLLAQADQKVRRREFSQAIGQFHEALKLRPNDVTARAMLADAERQARQLDWEAQRKIERDKGQAVTVAFQLQQQELMRQARAARRQAEKQAEAIAAAERQRQRRAAYDRLVMQARAARDKQDWKESLGLYESALGLERTDELFREADAIRTRLTEQQRLEAAQLSAAKEAALRKQRDDEIVRLKQQVEDERRQRDAREAARRKQQEDRDRAEYGRLINQAEILQSNRRYDEALGVLLAAQRLRPGSEIDERLEQVNQLKSKASPDGKKLAAEREKSSAKPSTDNTVQPLIGAQPKGPDPGKSETPPPLPKDKAKAETPPPLPKEKAPVDTPPPLPKEKAKSETPPQLPKDKAKAEPPPLPKDKAKTETPPPLPKDKAKAVTPPPLPKGPPAEFTRKMEAGAAAEKQGKYSDALAAYQQALRIVANDPAATKRADYAKQMGAGQKAQQARKFQDAIKAFEAALKIVPGDPAATRSLQQAKTGK